jgi:hypothetical protein
MISMLRITADEFWETDFITSYSEAVVLEGAPLRCVFFDTSFFVMRPVASAARLLTAKRRPHQSRASVFEMARYMLRRIATALGTSGGVAKGGRLATPAKVKRGAGSKKGDDSRLSCRLPMGSETVPRYSLESAEELERLAERMKRMWAEAVSGP